MKTPTRILVGGPEVTSAFVLMGLALARRAMMRGRRNSDDRHSREGRSIQYAQMLPWHIAELTSGFDAPHRAVNDGRTIHRGKLTAPTGRWCAGPIRTTIRRVPRCTIPY